MTIPRLDDGAIAELDISMLTMLLEVLGTESFLIALEKLDRDVNRSLLALQVRPDVEAQIKEAHRLKGLFRQFGGVRAAGIAERVEMSAAELGSDELNVVVNETRRTMALIRDAASDLISRENVNG